MADDKNKKYIPWLYSQLDILTRKNVIGPGTAKNIREYYGEVPESKKLTGTAIFTALGLTLIGFGILLIIAFNWDKFPRFPKVALSLAPLAAGLTLAYFAHKQRKKKITYMEGAGAFWFLSIGGTIALISQTYNIVGNLEGFLFIWLILALPVMYALGSSFAYFFYVAWVIWWASVAQNDGGYAVGFWFFMAAALPFFIKKFREDRYSDGVIRNSFITALAFTIGTGVSLEKCVPGLWIVIYMSMFSLLYLSSGTLYKDREGVLRRPFQWFSVLGIAILTLMLTMKWNWYHVGWNYYRTESRFNSIAAIGDYVIAVVLISAALLMLFDSFRYKKPWLMDYGAAPVVAIVCYLLMSFYGPVDNDIALLSVLAIMNIYAAYIGMKTIMAGVELRQMAVVNGGMLILGVLIMMRFFDLDFGLMERGVAFIVIGSAILAGSRLIAGRIGKKNG